jgi:hypothetical protein
MNSVEELNDFLLKGELSSEEIFDSFYNRIKKLMKQN